MGAALCRQPTAGERVSIAVKSGGMRSPASLSERPIDAKQQTRAIFSYRARLTIAIVRRRSSPLAAACRRLPPLAAFRQLVSRLSPDSRQQSESPRIIAQIDKTLLFFFLRT